MKFLMNILALAAIGAAGYMVEPHLRKQLTGLSPASGNSGTLSNGVFIPSDPIVAEKLAGLDLNRLTTEQLPTQITLKTDAEATDPGTGLKMILQAGNRVKPLRIEQGEVVFSPGTSSFEGRVPLGETDLPEQLAANPPVAAALETAPEPMISAAPAAPELDPFAPAPAPEPETAPTPAPAAAEVPAEFVPATPEEIVKTMQESIQSGQIQEFKFDQVTEWKAGEIETVDGEKFNTGLLSYQGETFLGIKSIQAKAFIRGGKVVRWIMPKSGMEIK